MEPFIQHQGIVVPINQMNVDTDSIMPKEFIKRIERTGFGQFLFYQWRFDVNGNEKSDFIMNQEPYRKASIMLARKNFGCGSSREHAPWGLQDYGIKVLLAPSYGDIFYTNCLKIGLLPIVLSEDEIEEIFCRTLINPGMKLEIDLRNMVIRGEDELVMVFTIDPYQRNLLLNGLDDIALTNQHEKEIREFEQRHKIYYQLK